MPGSFTISATAGNKELKTFLGCTCALSPCSLSPLLLDNGPARVSFDTVAELSRVSFTFAVQDSKSCSAAGFGVYGGFHADVLQDFLYKKHDEGVTFKVPLVEIERNWEHYVTDDVSKYEVGELLVTLSPLSISDPKNTFQDYDNVHAYAKLCFDSGAAFVQKCREDFDYAARMLGTRSKLWPTRDGYGFSLLPVHRGPWHATEHLHRRAPNVNAMYARLARFLNAQPLEGPTGLALTRMRHELNTSANFLAQSTNYARALLPALNGIFREDNAEIANEHLLHVFGACSKLAQSFAIHHYEYDTSVTGGNMSEKINWAELPGFNKDDAAYLLNVGSTFSDNRVMYGDDCEDMANRIVHKFTFYSAMARLHHQNPTLVATTLAPTTAAKRMLKLVHALTSDYACCMCGCAVDSHGVEPENHVTVLFVPLPEINATHVQQMRPKLPYVACEATAPNQQMYALNPSASLANSIAEKSMQEGLRHALASGLMRTMLKQRKTLADAGCSGVDNLTSSHLQNSRSWYLQFIEFSACTGNQEYNDTYVLNEDQSKDLTVNVVMPVLEFSEQAQQAVDDTPNVLVTHETTRARDDIFCSSAMFSDAADASLSHHAPHVPRVTLRVTTHKNADAKKLAANLQASISKTGATLCSLQRYSPTVMLACVAVAGL